MILTTAVLSSGVLRKFIFSMLFLHFSKNLLSRKATDSRHFEELSGSKRISGFWKYSANQTSKFISLGESGNDIADEWNKCPNFFLAWLRKSTDKYRVKIASKMSSKLVRKGLDLVIGEGVSRSQKQKLKQKEKQLAKKQKRTSRGNKQKQSRAREVRGLQLSSGTEVIQLCISFLKWSIKIVHSLFPFTKIL